MSSFRRKQMLAAGASRDIIYQLYNHTCDGTVSTALDTGIEPLSHAYTGWTLEIDFELTGYVYGGGMVVWCRDTFGQNLGFDIRSSSFDVMCSIGTASSISGSLGDRWSVMMEYDNSTEMASITFENTTTHSSYQVPLQSMSNHGFGLPLTIGGKYSDNNTKTWDTTTFGKVIIHSLVLAYK